MFSIFFFFAFYPFLVFLCFELDHYFVKLIMHFLYINLITITVNYFIFFF